MTQKQELALAKLFRLWDRHPYSMTLADYYAQLECMRVLR